MIFGGVFIFGVFGGVLFSGGNILVCVLVRTLWGSTDLAGVVRTWWGQYGLGGGSTDLVGGIRTWWG